MLSKKEDTNRIRDFFEKRARDYDSYYQADKSVFRRTLDFIFRRSMAQRFKMALEECSANGAKSVLDIGCGSGRYAVDLIKSGSVSRVTGIDFSSSMIDLARQYARKHRLEDKCTFVYHEFETADFEGKYDISVALGFFDYTRESETYLQKIKDVTSHKIIISFPAKWRLRNIVRILRLALLNCPVYFYTPSRIKDVLESVAIHNYTIKTIDRDYFVVAIL